VLTDWPVTNGAYSSYNITDSIVYPQSVVRNSDAFVKIDLQTFVNANSSLGGLLRSCSPITATFATNPNLGSVTIIPGDGSAAVNTNTLVHSYNAFGTYTALVIAGADSSTCNIIDSIKILVKYGPPPERLLKDKSISCNGNVLLLDAGNKGATYLWNTGETSQTIRPNTTGIYWVMIENDFCDITDSTFATVEDSQSFTLPNAFTPNGDGQNDSFCLKGWKHCNESFSVMIFNRWGEKVFESEDPDFCWDGTLRGKPLSNDVYVYHIAAIYQGTTVIQKKGNITIIR
jgi:gliding motility-associated-like protein